MFRRIVLAATLSFATVAAPMAATAHTTRAPELSSDARNAYRAIFEAIDAHQWAVATTLIDAAPDGPLRAVARAELYLAPGSPRVALDPLMALIRSAPWLPQADQLARLAIKRGAGELPDIPGTQRLVYLGAAGRRAHPRSVADAAADTLREQVNGAIKQDNPAGAEAMVEGAAATLTPDALTELRERVAWSYYIENDDTNARRMASRAATGTGDWSTQAMWVLGLADWRLKDFAGAETAFDNVASRSDNADQRSAGYYWGARAAIAGDHPERAQPRLQNAAQAQETLYGLLAAEALGMRLPHEAPEGVHGIASIAGLSNQPALVAAVELADLKRTGLAEQMLHGAALHADAASWPRMIALARALDLPATQLWLAHHGPTGTRVDHFARYPAPHWAPQGGWRVDPALVFAHALQESQFMTDVTSPAGARGLMQVLPGTAADFARRRGASFTTAELTDPGTNLEYGQSFLEQLRDMAQTGGLLPKVIAAYNAGPAPVGRWDSQIRADGDPLLWIESIPYAETRAYVGIVLRNYWMYQREAGVSPASLTVLAQNMWPRFPTVDGRSVAVRSARHAGGIWEDRLAAR